MGKLDKIGHNFDALNEKTFFATKLSKQQNTAQYPLKHQLSQTITFCSLHFRFQLILVFTLADVPAILLHY